MPHPPAPDNLHRAVFVSGFRFVQKLEGKSGIVGNRMPNNGPPYLTDGQMMILRRWVAIGAPRN